MLSTKVWRWLFKKKREEFSSISLKYLKIIKKLPLLLENFPRTADSNGKTFSRLFSELEKTCKDAVLIKRARHVIGEIERTKRAAESLKSQDFVNVSWLELFWLSKCWRAREVVGYFYQKFLTSIFQHFCGQHLLKSQENF